MGFISPKTFVVATILMVGVAYAVPDILPQRFSRKVIRFLVYDGLMAVIYTLFIYPFCFNPLRHLPGPTSYDPIFGNGIAQFTKPPADEMRKWVQNIPNDGLLCFREFLNRRTLIPTSAETLKSVLADNAYDWEKPEPVRKFLGKILGFGLLMVEGDIHKFQRKNILPSFQLKHLRELYPVFWSKAGQLVQVIEEEVRSEGLEKAEPVIEFGEWATRVTLDIIGLAGMGCDFNSIKNDDNQLVRDYKALLEPSMARVIYYAVNLLGPQELIQKLPWSQNKLLADITGNLKSFCFELVRNKREEFKLNGKAGDDILALLIQSNNFSDEELVDQMLTFLAAGHETTSSAMTWAVWLLATHPDWQRQLGEEVRAALPSPSSSEQLSVTEIESLPILNAVCNETLRLYPTIPITTRVATRDTYIGTLAIPKLTRAQIIPWAINRSHHLWGPDSEKFMPERWLAPGTANTGGARSNYAQITFLHGPRSCIGMGFAKAEFKCLLAAVAGSFEMEMADPNEKVWPAGVITTKPAHGMRLKMRKVEGW